MKRAPGKELMPPISTQQQQVNTDLQIQNNYTCSVSPVNGVLDYIFILNQEWMNSSSWTEPQMIHRKYFTKHKPSDSYGQLDAKLNLGAVQWIDIHAKLWTEIHQIHH